MNTKLISIVTPAYNEEQNILLLSKYVNEIFSQKSMSLYRAELIIVDDGSSDNTWNRIKEVSGDTKSGNNQKTVDKDILRKQKTHETKSYNRKIMVKGLKLSRNFGQQVALSAGMEIAKGDAIITIDADLQQPVSAIIEMIHNWEKGYKVVYTKRDATEGEGRVKKLLSVMFYKVLNILSDTRIEYGIADFMLLDREVANYLTSMKEHSRFIRGLIPWMGFKSICINYTAQKRKYGTSKYSLSKNLEFAKNGILSFSIKPLRYIWYFGIFLMLFSGFFLTISVVLRVITGGWYLSPIFTLTIFNTLLIGIVIISIGVLSFYISNIHYEVINRPLYIIDEKTKNFKK